MRVARSYPSGEVRIETAPEPVAGPAEVVCEVLACGVCATDVIDWYVADRLPAVLGHEPVGRVLSLGDGAGSRQVAVGDRVAIHHHAGCGECRRCRRGHETMCEQFRATGLRPGGFAERVVVPASLVGELLPLPDGVDDVSACLTEPLACVLRSQDRAGLRAGDSLLVVGAGVNGLLQVAAAHARAVDVVWVRELRPDRLALAESWGAERHGNEPVEVAIVCTPSPDAIAVGLAALAPGGTLCLYAPPAPGDGPLLDGSDLYLREVTVTSSYSATRAEMVAALELIASGEIDVAPLVTAVDGLGGTAEALARQRRGEGIKTVLRPGCA
jgi:L-iditol 2-dehydrogenase